MFFGSFVNALCWRVHQQELKAKSQKPKARTKALSTFSFQLSAKKSQYSILYGRSQCPSCQHQLASKDLIPVLSWLFLRGRCRYCKMPISVQYPLVELSLAAVFVVSYVFWPATLSGGQWWLFGAWLASSVGLMALLVYDAKWMLLPNRILYPTLLAALVGQISYIVFYAPDVALSFWLLALSLAIASGIFWIIFTISNGKWIGYGDVRLGLVTGTLLADPKLAALMIFVASVLGTLFALPDMLRGKKSAMSKIPFGPFLIAGTMIALLFGNDIIDWYTNLL